MEGTGGGRKKEERDDWAPSVFSAFLGSPPCAIKSRALPKMEQNNVLHQVPTIITALRTIIFQINPNDVEGDDQACRGGGDDEFLSRQFLRWRGHRFFFWWAGGSEIGGGAAQHT